MGELAVWLLPSCLNESPSKKEGKFQQNRRNVASADASMKAPPKRKGNV